jgi:hypothetical protein
MLHEVSLWTLSVYSVRVLYFKLYKILRILVHDTLYFMLNRLCGLVVRVPGYRTEMYCVSCEV